MYDPPMRVLSILILLIASTFAGETEVSGARALEVVKTLASREFQGRKSGLEGGRIAEEWMAGRLAALGLEQPDGHTYFHEFKASVTQEGPGALLRIGDEERTFLEDYVTLIYSGRGKAEAEVVFVGYGIHAPGKGHDDYAGIDVNGKIVLAVRGRPERSVFDEERYIGYKSSTAADRGAVGFLLCEGDNAVPGTIQEKYHRPALPAVWLSRSAADAILIAAGKGDLALRVARLKKGRHESFPLGVRARLEIDARLLKDRPLRNVVGIWPGETDEYVVLGAHLDHVGVDAVGNVYHGADDNASGSAMLHEVARAIVKSGKRFRRSLLFVWFAGEEQGLIGSRAFVKKPPVPLQKIAVMLNTDMVGQGKPVIAVGGAEVYPRDFAMLGDFAVEGIETELFRAASNSDHYPFQASGVPAFFVHTKGPHPNYHQPADDWKNIEPELLEIAGRFVRTVAERAATTDRPLCRPRRKAEYLWYDAEVVDFGTRGVGVDLRVHWTRDPLELDGILEQLEEEDAPVNHYAYRGRKLGALLHDLKPTVVLGLRGAMTLPLSNLSSRLGVMVFSPSKGPLARLAKITTKERYAVVGLDRLALETDIAGFPGGLFVGAEHAPAWEARLATRKGPWVVIVDAGDPAAVLDASKRYGGDHVLAVQRPGFDDPGKAIEPLLDAGLDAKAISMLLGGNFIRMLE